MPTEPDNTHARRGWRRHALPAGLGALVLAALAALGLYLARGDGAPAGPAAAPPPPSGPQFFGRQANEGGLPAPDTRAEQRRQLVEQVKLTDHTYCSYLEGTRYPHASRPAAQHADQIHPNQPIAEMNPMRLEGGKSSADVLLQSSQSRVYLAAGEGVAFTLRTVDAQGQVVPLVITRAVAQGMTYGDSRPTPQVSLAFADDGGGADPVAGDGTFTAVLSPAQGGLAGFHGTIRTEVRYNAGGRSGFVLFDVVYTPTLPAVWTGQVREATEDGSLQFYLRAEVRQPGRYIVSGRVDDARGRPFALATFNDLLGPGPQDVKLTVFGKLMHDGAPQLPLVLRDVEGYLLRENLDPDRLLMPRLEGRVFASKTGSLKGISDEEWQSEERSRYLTEYAKDRNAARARLAAFDPEAPLPPSACAAPR
ncbi:choice-of-anchor X domain-containing protein [Massilia niastensis]|uniref:choice-of-anchor X domain-containing protein n=1 Tax=Massilia niastensis TaxID=544911 RepID=UPI00036AAF00|nr:choice-of-anchor X domain-containing protein [Massilia niastensis]